MNCVVADRDLLIIFFFLFFVGVGVVNDTDDADMHVFRTIFCIHVVRLYYLTSGTAWFGSLIRRLKLSLLGVKKFHDFVTIFTIAYFHAHVLTDMGVYVLFKS